MNITILIILLIVLFAILTTIIVILTKTSSKIVQTGSYRFLVSAQCKKYQDWQCAVLDWSIKKRWPTARYTRVLSCDNPEYKYQSVVDSSVVRDWGIHPETGDGYLPYNRPAGLVEYFKHCIPNEEYLIIVDPDTILRKPLDDIPVTKGRPVAQKYEYLTRGDALQKIAKEILGSSDNVQPIGMPMIIYRDDLVKLAPVWLKYTEEIRNNPTTKALAGWTAEMHSYCLAAAKLGLKHLVRKDLADRTPYNRVADPYFYHYDFVHEWDDFKWDKRDYMDTDFFASNDQMPVPSKYPNNKCKQLFIDINNGLDYHRK